jgi:hypothetical protein
MRSLFLVLIILGLGLGVVFAGQIELNTEYRVSNLNRSQTFNFVSASGPIQIDISLAQAGSTPDKAILFPGALNYNGSMGEFSIPGTPPWDIMFRDTARNGAAWSFTKTSCPFANVSQRGASNIRISGSPERTGNVPGEVSFKVTSHPLELTKGKMISNSMGRGVMYHVFDVHDESSPTHIRFVTYPRGTAGTSDLGALTYTISRESCPDPEQDFNEDGDTDSCNVRLEYNKDTTIYNLSVAFDADSRDPPELSAYLPEGFYSESEWSNVDAYGVDLSTFQRANRFVLFRLRPDDSKTSNRGERKTRTLQGVLLKAFSKDMPKAKDFGIFALNGRLCHMKTYITNRKGLVVNEFKSSSYQPANNNRPEVFRAKVRDGVYTVGSGGKNLPPGRYVLAFKWNNPWMKLDYDLGTWNGPLAPSLKLETTSDGSFVTKQDTPFRLPFTISDSAGENRQFVELNLQSSAGMKMCINNTIEGIVISNKDYRLGDFVRGLQLQGSVRAVTEAISAIQFQSDVYYGGTAKLRAALIDKSCFSCNKPSNVMTTVDTTVKFEKIEHPPEFDLNAEDLNILEGQTELNLPHFVNRLRTVEGAYLDTNNGSIKISMRYDKSPIFDKEPKLIMSNKSSSFAGLYATFTKGLGESEVCVKVEQPSLEKPGSMLTREKCGRIQRQPVEGCEFIAKPSLLFVTQLGKPSMLNLTLTCRPYDLVQVPLKLSNKNAARLSVPQTNLTVRQWRSRLISISGTAVNKSLPFEITVGPLDTRDVRYKGKTATFQMWNRDYTDDCSDNKEAWWCAEYHQTSDATTSLHLKCLSLLLAFVVTLFFI